MQKKKQFCPWSRFIWKNNHIRSTEFPAKRSLSLCRTPTKTPPECTMHYNIFAKEHTSNKKWFTDYKRNSVADQTVPPFFWGYKYMSYVEDVKSLPIHFLSSVLYVKLGIGKININIVDLNVIQKGSSKIQAKAVYFLISVQLSADWEGGNKKENEQDTGRGRGWHMWYVLSFSIYCCYFLRSLLFFFTVLLFFSCFFAPLPSRFPPPFVISSPWNPSAFSHPATLCWLTTHFEKKIHPRFIRLCFINITFWILLIQLRDRFWGT